jgi:hypothetical protein
MRFPALQRLQESESFPRIQDFRLSESRGLTVINDLVPIRVWAVDSSLANSTDLDLRNDSTSIGILCFCRRLGNVNLGTLSEPQFAAYLVEVEEGQEGQPFQFAHDYAVIEVQYLEEYLTHYRDSSAIWGGFSHVAAPPIRQRSLAAILCQKDIRYPTKHHQEQAVRAVTAAHPYDRYLKLYHQLELLFDWVVVRNIQFLGEDLQGVAQVLSRYSAGDLPSLERLLREYCDQPPPLWEIMRQVEPNFRAIAHTVFQEYGKTGNPIGEKWEALLKTLAKGAYDINHAQQEKLAKKPEDFAELVIRLTAYWLFRIRCCIAHNRIGEFILGESQQDFLVEFGEPLLKEALRQVLSHRKLPRAPGPQNLGDFLQR